MYIFFSKISNICFDVSFALYSKSFNPQEQMFRSRHTNVPISVPIDSFRMSKASFRDHCFGPGVECTVPFKNCFARSFRYFVRNISTCTNYLHFLESWPNYICLLFRFLNFVLVTTNFALIEYNLYMYGRITKWGIHMWVKAKWCQLHCMMMVALVVD